MMVYDSGTHVCESVDFEAKITMIQLASCEFTEALVLHGICDFRIDFRRIISGFD